MKLLTYKAKLRQLRFVKWGNEKRCKCKPNKRINRRSGHDSHIKTVRVPKLLQYHVPRQTRYIFEEFTKDVEFNLNQGRSVLIDFSDTIRLYPCGLLLLMGLIESWNNSYPGKLQATYPLDDRVEQMLQQVQLLEKLGLPARKTITHIDVTRWHYFSGVDVDAGQTDPFKLEMLNIIPEEEGLALFDCINEAMTNVKQHAYSKGNEGGWWMFATVSESKIYVAIHDRGMSIPVTLLNRPTVGDIFKIRHFRRDADGELIAAATGARTNTKLPWRGQGLPEMLEFASKYPKSGLGIYSRNGFFRYSPDNTHAHGKLDTAVNGTLVLWMVDLSREQE